MGHDAVKLLIINVIYVDHLPYVLYEVIHQTP